MTDRRRLDLTEVDDWLGEMSFSKGEVYGTPPRRGARLRGPNWQRVREVLQHVFPGAAVDTAPIERAGRNINRTQFVVPVRVKNDRGESGRYVVSLPNNREEDHPPNPGHDFGYPEDWESNEVPPDDVDAPDAYEAEYRVRARREFRVLVQMARDASLPFRAPRPIALLLDGGAPVLVVSHVGGTDLDAQASSPDAVKVAASVAASLHALDIDAAGAPTRRDAALVEIHALERPDAVGVGGPHEALVREAIAFARTMLPPADPSRFMHGSLTTQTIVTPDHGAPDGRPGVFDFSRAHRGDPAQEIASLLRGAKVALDRATFLDEYARAGGAPVAVTELDVYDAIHLAWRVRFAGTPEEAPPQVQQLAALLKRA
jgi:hypothetical protein